VIWSLVYYALVYFLEGETYSLAGYAKNLVVGYPFNFVPLLLAFYAVAPVLARLGQRFPWLTLLAMGGYQLFVINVLKPGTLGFAFPDWAYALTPPALRVSVAVWGIFFPLGMVYSLHAARWLPVLQRVWPVLALAAVVLFALAALQELSLVNAPLADILCPVGVILLFPLVRRDRLPFLGALEQLGKRAYGLYLTNLIVLNLVLALIHALAPWAFGQLLLLTLVVFALTLTLPRLLMNAVERLPYPKAHRYVFG
jgi:peptidoglycan/LPS O-acetylase OafA/YrhL